MIRPIRHEPSVIASVSSGESAPPRRHRDPLFLFGSVNDVGVLIRFMPRFGGIAMTSSL